MNYSDTRTTILKQLDRIHLLLTYPFFVAETKAKFDELREPKTSAVTSLMEKAKNELLEKGIFSDETVSEFCELMECDKNFAIAFLNNSLDFTPGHDFDE